MVVIYERTRGQTHVDERGTIMDTSRSYFAFHSFTAFLEGVGVDLTSVSPRST